MTVSAPVSAQSIPQHRQTQHYIFQHRYMQTRTGCAWGSLPSLEATESSGEKAALCRVTQWLLYYNRLFTLNPGLLNFRSECIFVWNLFFLLWEMELFWTYIAVWAANLHGSTLFYWWRLSVKLNSAQKQTNLELDCGTNVYVNIISI